MKDIYLIPIDDIILQLQQRGISLEISYIDAISILYSLKANMPNKCPPGQFLDSGKCVTSVDITQYVLDGVLEMETLQNIDGNHIIFKDEAGIVKSIEQSFLKGSNIVSIKFSGFSNLESIGDEFLSNCEDLELVDLSELKNVKIIGYQCLSNCEKLQSVNLSGFSEVEYIGGNFLSFCENLKSLDLSSFSNLESIGEEFLSYCKNIESLDLFSLTNVQNIEGYFLSYCENLKYINNLSSLNIDIIEKGFLYNCKSLESVDLSGLKNAKRIKSFFLYGCENIEFVDLSNLINLERIGKEFLSDCAKLRKVNFSNLNVKRVGYDFLSDSPNISTVIVNNKTSYIILKNIIEYATKYNKQELKNKFIKKLKRFQLQHYSLSCEDDDTEEIQEYATNLRIDIRNKTNKQLCDEIDKHCKEYGEKEFSHTGCDNEDTITTLEELKSIDPRKIVKVKRGNLIDCFTAEELLQIQKHNRGLHPLTKEPIPEEAFEEANEKIKMQLPEDKICVPRPRIRTSKDIALEEVGKLQDVYTGFNQQYFEELTKEKLEYIVNSVKEYGMIGEATSETILRTEDSYDGFLKLLQIMRERTSEEQIAAIIDSYISEE